jgi:Fusaric acid resistance protein-like
MDNSLVNIPHSIKLMRSVYQKYGRCAKPGFSSDRTRGETLVKAWQRVIGTLAGVIAGVVLAALIGGNVVVSVVFIVVALFMTFYWSQASYSLMVFFLTTMLIDRKSSSTCWVWYMLSVLLTWRLFVCPTVVFDTRKILLCWRLGTPLGVGDGQLASISNSSPRRSFPS